MSTEDTYLRSVERMLRGIAPAHRTAVLDDLRAHFADAEEAGRSVDEVVQSLGTPREIADRAHEEFGAASDVEARAEFAWRTLQWSAVVLAVVTGVVAAFVMPSYTGSTETVTSDGTVVSVGTTQSLVAVNGLWVALIALVPAVVAAVPLIVPRRMRVVTAVVAAALLTAMALIGGFTLGGFFLPTAMLSWAALIAWIRLRGPGFGIGWRIAGAVLTALPIALSLPLFGFGMPGRYADTPSVTVSAWAWPFLVAILVIAVLIVIGYRAAGWALAVIGLAVLVMGLLSGELLTLLFIWLGGFWLTIGLAHAVTASRRR